MAYLDYQFRRLIECKGKYQAFITVYPKDIADFDGEIWRDYKDNYQISNFGRLKSIYKHSARILTPAILGTYLVFELRKFGKRERRLAHRLVAETFIPNPDNKPQVNHIDGIKFNNHVSNLEWVTQSENIQHSLERGLKKSGENNYLAALTNEQAAWIRSVYKPYDKEFGAVALARALNVSEGVIRLVISGRHYKF